MKTEGPKEKAQGLSLESLVYWVDGLWKQNSLHCVNRLSPACLERSSCIRLFMEMQSSPYIESECASPPFYKIF